MSRSLEPTLRRRRSTSTPQCWSSTSRFAIKSARISTAKAVADRHEERFIEAEGSCGGNPRDRRRRLGDVRIALGNRFSGTYFVTSATHALHCEGRVSPRTSPSRVRRRPRCCSLLRERRPRRRRDGPRDRHRHRQPGSGKAGAREGEVSRGCPPTTRATGRASSASVEVRSAASSSFRRSTTKCSSGSSRATSTTRTCSADSGTERTRRPRRPADRERWQGPATRDTVAGRTHHPARRQRRQRRHHDDRTRTATRSSSTAVEHAVD